MYALQDVYDKLDYLSSLGKTQTASVQRDADIGVAEAERDAGIRVSLFAFSIFWSSSFCCVILDLCCFYPVTCIDALHLFIMGFLPPWISRKLSARRKWWISSSRQTLKWQTQNENWNCKRLLSIKKSTLRFASPTHSSPTSIKLIKLPWLFELKCFFLAGILALIAPTQIVKLIHMPASAVWFNWRQVSCL